MKKTVFTVGLQVGASKLTFEILEGEGLTLFSLDNSGKKVANDIYSLAKGVTYRDIRGGLKKEEKDLFNLDVGCTIITSHTKRKKAKDIIKKASVFYEMLPQEISQLIEIPDKYFTKSVGELPTFMQAKLALLDTLSDGKRVVVVLDVFGNGEQKDKLTDFILAKKSKEVTYIVATDDIKLATLSSKAVVLEDGKVVEYGRVQKVLKNPIHPYAKWLIETIKKGKSSIVWRKASGKIKKHACKYALNCPYAGADCLKKVLFVNYDKFEYANCYLATEKLDKQKE